MNIWLLEECKASFPRSWEARIWPWLPIETGWNGRIVILHERLLMGEARVSMNSSESTWLIGKSLEEITEHELSELWKRKTKELEFESAKFWSFPNWTLDTWRAE